MKTAICCIIKEENLYLRYWVEYHLQLGFDTIILYDNNDVDGEWPHAVIGDYIFNGYVIYNDVRGVKTLPTDERAIQQRCFSECYNTNNDKYDWIAFIDIDEFITITDYNCISDFLTSSLFNDATIIKLSWLCYGDSNNIYYHNKPVTERFILPTLPFDLIDTCTNMPLNNNIKSIIRCIKDAEVDFKFSHTCIFTNIPLMLIKCVDGAGNPVDAELLWIPHNHENAYIRHYRTLSVSEFIIKRLGRKTYADSDNKLGSDNFLSVVMNIFTGQNEMTAAKEKIIDTFLTQI